MPNTTQFDRHKIEYNVIPKVLPESLSSLAWSAVRKLEKWRMKEEVVGLKKYLQQISVSESRVLKTSKDLTQDLRDPTNPSTLH